MPVGTARVLEKCWRRIWPPSRLRARVRPGVEGLAAAAVVASLALGAVDVDFASCVRASERPWTPVIFAAAEERTASQHEEQGYIGRDGHSEVQFL